MSRTYFIKTASAGFALAAGAVITLSSGFTQAHEPVFTPGAHVKSKGGQEIELEYERDRTSGAGDRETEQQLSLVYEYGVTSSWTVKAYLPLIDKTVNGTNETGLGDVTLGTKYRVLRVDRPGQQYSTTLLFQAKLPTAESSGTPKLGTGSTDFVVGALHGLESRRWYYNTAARYRFNTEGDGGFEKGDKLLLDIVGGVRPVLTKYKEPDTVLFLELNFEDATRDSLNGTNIADTGGWEMFLSPGIFWTYRTYAIVGGVQIPVAENLNDTQASSDYRFKLSFKYEF